MGKMSNTIEIHCDTCKVTYWFGQGRVHDDKHLTIYNQERLGDFLYEHRGHIMSTSDSDTGGEDVYDYEPDRYGYKDLRIDS